MISIDDKLNHLTDKKNNVYVGTNIIFNVFWILVNYTNNITLAIFLSERAELLFTEFLTLSKDPKVNKDLNYIPNITDAISFSYKKTIGPIHISDMSLYHANHGIKNSCFIIKILLQTLYGNYDGISLKDYLNAHINHISPIIFDLNKQFVHDDFFFTVVKKLLIFNNNKSLEEIYDFLEGMNKNKTKKISLQKNFIQNYTIKVINE